MLWAVYRQFDGYVLRITSQEPSNLPEGYAAAKVLERTAESESGFAEGDELEKFIIINHVDAEGNATAFAMYQQIPPVRDVLARIMELERAAGMRGTIGEMGIAKRLDDLEMAIAALVGGGV